MSNNGITATMRFNDSSASDNVGVSNLFYNYFSLFYTKGNVNISTISFHSFSDLSNNVIFSLDDVFVGLSSLKDINCVGPDGLFAYFLFYLWILFKRSFSPLFGS